ncbi:CbtA family protein [Paenirhodobacter sp.]|uniref:CbtA family protein n=1 Tax=Paenirhodobacter sp. TaxID=1965326 RepID=UPI003B3C9254
MTGSLLLRGMIAGLIAAIIAFGFASVFGEPEVDYAIALEGQKAAAAGEPEEPELVSRAVQSTTGLATGLLVYGAAAGGLFALIFAFAYGRIGALSARATSLLLAVAAFVAVVVVPQVKYPANPPAVGSPETIGARTGLFFVMVAVSILAIVLAVMLARRLWAQLGGWNAGIVAGAVWLIAVALIQIAMPTVNEIPPDFAADVLWRFRATTIGIHAILWTVIGLLFGALAAPRLDYRRA